MANEGTGGGGDATGDLEDDLDISDSDSDHRYANFNANWPLLSFSVKNSIIDLSGGKSFTLGKETLYCSFF